MGGRQRQRQQSAPGVVRRRRGGGQNNPETGSSVHTGDTTELHYHTLTHSSGVRNYECGKKFIRKSHLTTHTLTHSSGVKWCAFSSGHPPVPRVADRETPSQCDILDVLHCEGSLEYQIRGRGQRGNLNGNEPYPKIILAGRRPA